MVGHDGHRGWVYYVAVDPDQQGKDFGRAIMAAAEDWLRAQGVEKVMLMVRPDNTSVQAFYDRLGYDDAGARDLRQVARWPADDAVAPTASGRGPSSEQARLPVVLLRSSPSSRASAPALRSTVSGSRSGSSSIGESFAVRFTALDTS